MARRQSVFTGRSRWTAETPEFGLHVLYPPSRHLTARVRALLDHLARSFAGRWPRPGAPG